MRFKLPERLEAEEEEDVSGTSTVKCRQFSFIEEEMIGQEDCLLLNVYVPGEDLVSDVKFVKNSF